jgi:hypothetical protein
MSMRYAAFALMASLAGCSLVGNGTGGECVNDQQCGDDVCARSGECLAPSSVRQVQVRWTMNGAAADATSCAAHPNLFLQFNGPDYGDVLRFAPVPCKAGSFFVDRLPRRYQQVELGPEGATGDLAQIDATGASFDLPVQ